MRRLMRIAVPALAAIAVTLVVSRAAAWGMDVHRAITRRALDGLPAAIKPFFAERRDFIAEHAVDPDLWRVVGAKGELGEEDPNHFFQIDGFGEPPPFAGVPHAWNALVAKYGQKTADQNGHLPWRAEEIFGRMVTQFRNIGKPAFPYAADNVRYLGAVLAHYVEDAHVPFHATTDFDGRATQQNGVHGRFEDSLVLRKQDALTLAPVRVTPIPDIREFIIATIADSQSLVAPVLDADRRAAGGRTVYDDAYYAALFASVRPIVERRLSDAASAVASAIAAAWTSAGSPVLPLAKVPNLFQDVSR